MSDWKYLDVIVPVDLSADDQQAWIRTKVVQHCVENGEWPVRIVAKSSVSIPDSPDHQEWRAAYQTGERGHGIL
ncbi:hypothetical protein [Antrihabitans sp. YC2-6]|uniref:hypothetical protein n=1 Tax=Antrihabitans sp. YC2-6 TaxID=2799498 RepID=UPI0018F5FFA1|nr:hypothetical protein [Antrihabitans sp. YC2-6]MBJ8347151.1 hypothetical protein [Antrihabitans sp. YC2-6]